jgi:hypothetical protein
MYRRVLLFVAVFLMLMLATPAFSQCWSYSYVPSYSYDYSTYPAYSTPSYYYTTPVYIYQPPQPVYIERSVDVTIYHQERRKVEVDVWVPSVERRTWIERVR